MKAKKFIVFVAVPVGVSLALIAAYFSGIHWLQQVVSPRMPQLHRTAGRECGLLENLQNLCLLVMIGVCITAVRRKQLWAEKVAFALIAVFAIFIALEEIDYGLHCYERLKTVPSSEAAEVRNLHNLADVDKTIKKCADAGIVLLFVLLPLFGAKSKRPLVRYVTPDRFSILTVTAMVAVSKLAHALENAGFDSQRTISRNISEFRELFVYYLFMVYLVDIVFRRTLPPAVCRAEPADEAGR